MGMKTPQGLPGQPELSTFKSRLLIPAPSNSPVGGGPPLPPAMRKARRASGEGPETTKFFIVFL